MYEFYINSKKKDNEATTYQNKNIESEFKKLFQNGNSQDNEQGEKQCKT
jgi:zona occludens toxin (predicted ATPase)